MDAPTVAAHTHLGWRPVGTFTWQERAYTVLAHDLG